MSGRGIDPLNTLGSASRIVIYIVGPIDRAQLDAIRAAIQAAGDEDVVQILYEFPPDWRYTTDEPELAPLLVQATSAVM